MFTEKILQIVSDSNKKHPTITYKQPAAPNMFWKSSDYLLENVSPLSELFVEVYDINSGNIAYEGAAKISLTLLTINQAGTLNFFH